MTEAAGNNLREYVENGGTLVVSYFSGIVDEHDGVHEGACPGALRDVLGLTVEEFSPLLPGQSVRLTGPDGSELAGDVWTEFVVPRGAETVWTYADGLTAGHPAVTRHRLGEGTAWYVSTRLASEGLGALLGWAVEDARVAAPADLPRDVEVVRRTGDSGSYLFAINHTASDAKVPLEAHGTELLTGERAAGRLEVPAGAVRVVRLDG
jgi:beta-galactosidase